MFRFSFDSQISLKPIKWKPFPPEGRLSCKTILLRGADKARIQALIRRCRVYDNADASDTTASSTIERCGLTLDTKCNNVSYDGRQLALTDKEYQILLLLISHPTKTFSTQNIFESVWNEPYTQFSNNTIMVHIKNLRNKL